MHKCGKLVYNLNDKKSDVEQIRNLKQVLHYRQRLKKVRRVIKFNQKDRLKPYIAMNTGLQKTQIMILKN